MNKRGQNEAIFQEKALNEVVYSAIMAMTPEQSRSLPDRYKKKIKNAAAARKFAETSSTDQKRELLSYLDFGHFLVIHPGGIFGVKRFQEVMGKYQAGAQYDGLTEAAKSGVFVSSDREFAFYAGKMSQDMTSAPYFQNLQLMSLNGLKKWKGRLKGSADEYDETAIKVAQLLLWGVIQFQKTEFKLGIKQQQLMVLFYFYSQKGKYLSAPHIMQYFVGEMGRDKITSILKYLTDTQLIQKHYDWEKKEYTLTKLGVRKVHQFRDIVLKSF